MRVIAFEKNYSNTAALEEKGTGKKNVWYVGISSNERDNYGPFINITAFNGSSNKVDLYFDHDDTRAFQLLPGEKINITNTKFAFVSLANQNTVNGISAGLLDVTISNFN